MRAVAVASKEQKPKCRSYRREPQKGLQRVIINSAFNELRNVEKTGDEI